MKNTLPLKPGILFTGCVIVLVMTGNLFAQRPAVHQKNVKVVKINKDGEVIVDTIITEDAHFDDFDILYFDKFNFDFDSLLANINFDVAVDQFFMDSIEDIVNSKDVQDQVSIKQWYFDGEGDIWENEELLELLNEKQVHDQIYVYRKNAKNYETSHDRIMQLKDKNGILREILIFKIEEEDRALLKELNITDSTAENDTLFALKIFPNPGDGNVNVAIENSTRQECSMKIYNLSGKEVFAKNSSLELIGFSIDISKYGSGTYFFSVQADQGAITRKIIIN